MSGDNSNQGDITPRRSRSSTTMEGFSSTNPRGRPKRSTLLFTGNREAIRNDVKKEKENVGIDKSKSFCGTVSMKTKKKKLTLKKFKKKFLVLVNESIEVYANDQEMIPELSLNLSECLKVYVHPKKDTHFKLVFKNGKYRFKTVKAVQAQHWVNYIQTNLEAMQLKVRMSQLKLVCDQTMSDILGHFWKPKEQIKMELLRSKQFSNLVKKRESLSTTASEITLHGDTPTTPKVTSPKESADKKTPSSTTTPLGDIADDDEDELSENYAPVESSEDVLEVPLYQQTTFDHKIHFMVQYESFSDIHALEFLTRGEVFHFLHKILRDIGNVPNLHRIVIRQTPVVEKNNENSSAATGDTNDEEPNQTCIETDGVLYFNVGINLDYLTQQQLTQLLQSFDMKRTISQLESNGQYSFIISKLKTLFNLEDKNEFPIDFIMSAASINEFNDADLISLLQNLYQTLDEMKSTGISNYGFDVIKYLSTIFSSLHIIGTKRIRINHGNHQEIISGKVSDLKKFLPNRVYEIAADYYSSKIANVGGLKIEIVPELQELAHLEYIASKVEKRYENIPINIDTVRIQFRDEATATCIDKKVLIDCVSNRNEGKPSVSPSNPRRSRTRTFLRSPIEGSSPASGRNSLQPKRSRSRTLFNANQILSPKHPNMPVYASPPPITFVLNSSKLNDYLESYTLTQRIRTPLQQLFQDNNWSLEETDLVKVIKTAISKLRNLWKDIDECLPLSQRIDSLITGYSNLVNISLEKSDRENIDSELETATDFQSIAFVLLRIMMPLALTKSANMNRDVIIYGIPKVGKTTLLHKLKYGGDRKTMPSVGVVSETVHYQGLNITLHDVPQNHLKHFMRRMATSKVSGIIYVMDGSNVDNIGPLQKIIKKCAKRYKTDATPPSISSPSSPAPSSGPTLSEAYQEPTTSGPTISIEKDNTLSPDEELIPQSLPLLVFANKQDVEAYEAKDIVEQALKKRKVLVHVEKSTFTEDKGIKEGLTWLTQHMK